MSWHQLDLIGTVQQSVPLSTRDVPRWLWRESLFGKDFADFMTLSEKKLVEHLAPFPLKIACPQLSADGGQLSHFYLWIALPTDRMLNFMSTGVLYQADFPFLGRVEENLRMNFSLNARSALLFLAFAQSKSRMDYPGSHEYFDSGSEITLMAFKIETRRLLEGISKGTFGVWNRRYLDYFLSVPDFLQLGKHEADTLEGFTFTGQTIETLVDDLNGELDEWKGPNGEEKTFHWRHFHLALHKLSIVEALIGLESDMEPPVEALSEMVRTLSESSLSSWLEIKADDSPTLSPAETLREDDAEVLCTEFGTKYHFYADCPGMNKRPFKPFKLFQVEACRALCSLCKSKRSTLDFVSQNFGGGSSSSTDH